MSDNNNNNRFINNLYNKKDNFTYKLYINDYVASVYGQDIDDYGHDGDRLVIKVGSTDTNIEEDLASTLINLLQASKLEYDIDEIGDTVIYGFGRKFILNSNQDEEELKKLIRATKNTKNKRYTKKDRYQF